MIIINFQDISNKVTKHLGIWMDNGGSLEELTKSTGISRRDLNRKTMLVESQSKRYFTIDNLNDLSKLLDIPVGCFLFDDMSIKEAKELGFIQLDNEKNIISKFNELKKRANFTYSDIVNAFTDVFESMAAKVDIGIGNWQKYIYANRHLVHCEKNYGYIQETNIRYYFANRIPFAFYNIMIRIFIDYPLFEDYKIFFEN